MGGADEQYLRQTGEAAKRGREAARSKSVAASEANDVRKAIIMAGNSGVYTVQLLGADGQGTQTIQGLLAWTNSALTVGERCRVRWVNGIPEVEPISGGSGGGGDQLFFVTGLMFLTS